MSSSLPNGTTPPQPLDAPLAAIYARVSTEDQGRGYSIPTQIDGCQRLAKQQGYVVLPSNIMIDEGISGTTLERPASAEAAKVRPNSQYCGNHRL